MLDRAKEIIDDIARETDEIILMHSMSGKDSIVLMDLVYPKFRRVVVCFMYIVPNMRHIRRYFLFVKRRYPNVELIQVPHYTLFSYRKYGFQGMRGNPNQRYWRFTEIVGKVREKVGIEWCCVGFKQADSLNRRLMLRSYKDGKMAISWKGKMFYPLSTYKNRDCMEYIAENRLKSPEWSNKKEVTSGDDIIDYHYLKFLERDFPDDLELIYSQFPATRVIIPKWEAEEAERKAQKEAEKELKRLSRMKGVKVYTEEET